MSTAQSVVKSRLEALKSRHAELEEKLHTESLKPSVSDFYLKQIKRMKLQLKDEIENIAATA
ncbi:MAG: DUF465 domain-containing protein [Alphaproteobacteria bacterium]|nr:DUF465 domain-containing protein [Alphaproteobacteria bacterium]